jgi:DNA-binding transcriptional ArsR family regulator
MTAQQDIPALVPRLLFKALADPTRVAILNQVCCGSSPKSVGDIALGVDTDLSVVSRNIAQLRDAGLLCCVRDGKRVLCSLDTSEVVVQLRALADALELCCPNGPLVEESHC